MAQPLFTPDQTTTIEITFSQSDWSDLLHAFQAAGSDERLPATVEINGVPFDSVGIRYRGGSTYDPTLGKNPLNLKLDHFKNQDYQGYKVLKLGNGLFDPSFLREVLAFELAAPYLVVPKANFATVFVNGNFHGLFSHVESVNSGFFEKSFLSDADNARFECLPSYSFDEPPATAPFGCTEGQGANLAYLGPGIVCYLPHYNIQSATGWNDLVELTQVLKEQPDMAREVLDLDRFSWMSAWNTLLVNLDSYLGAGARNYVIGKADNGRFVPIPDDANEAFGRFPWVSLPNPGDPFPTAGQLAALDPFLGADDPEKPLLQAIFGQPTWRRMYTAHLRTLLTERVSGGWLSQRAYELSALVNGPLQADNLHAYSPQEVTANLTETVLDAFTGEPAFGLLPFLAQRADSLLAHPALQAPPPILSGFSFSPAQPQPGTALTLTLPVSGADQVWLGYRSHIKEMFTLVLMADDGTQGDGLPDDGIFGAVIPAGTGATQFYFYAENQAAGAFSPARAEFEFHTVPSTGTVVINEFLASNQETVADQDGEFNDWIELTNTSAETIDLSGWYLSDNADLPAKWAFPNGVFLDPGSYLVVWADGDTDQAGLHTNFSISAAGEELLLVRPDLSVADQVFFGPQSPDISMARCPDGTGTFQFAAPSFAADNGNGCTTAASSADADRSHPSFFPNPASDRLTIGVPGNRTLPVQVCTATGRTVFHGILPAGSSVDVSAWSPGLYFLRIGDYPPQRLAVIR